ncbi:MAG TPA: MG2 domain-containing protein [Pirellulaceae bacterium]|nr:MG2 domain-containing protein [Pirellulaceae bacterium]
MSPKTTGHSDPEQRKLADRKFAEGNFRDAMEIYLKLARHPQAQGITLAADYSRIGECLINLQRIHEWDAIREELIELHSQDWRLLQAVAESYVNTEAWGFWVAGEFLRGGQRGGGAWADASERDRVRALQVFMAAQGPMLADPHADGEAKGQFYLSWAGAIRYQRDDFKAWRLQSLTNLDTLPDYDVSDGHYGHRWPGWGEEPSKGAPVDAEGNPVFYSIPASWAAASNDGERWRWCLEQVAEHDINQRMRVDWEFASFLHSQFGVQTMAMWGINLPRWGVDGGDMSSDPAANPFALHSLAETETIARLATGVKRITLPDEFNPIRWFQKISQQRSTYQDTAYATLASIFEDRQQYPRAATYWRQAIEVSGANDGRRDRLSQIVDPWGRFEPIMSQPADAGATVEFRFRNGQEVSFTAHRLKIDELLKDIKAYLNSKPRNLDWQQLQIDSIGHDLVEGNRRKYQGEQVAQWALKLEPRPNHFDRRMTVNTPLQKAGAYLLTAQMKNGNTSHVVLWIEDLALLRKPGTDTYYYFVGDAVSGQPVAGANVEFFGWRTTWEQDGRVQRLETANFAENSDADGLIVTDPKLFDQNFQWMTIARTSAGRMAFMGFQGAWTNRYNVDKYRQTKVYGITDRPIYRPGQQVHFKFWLREASYEQGDQNPFANHKLMLTIRDPQGTEVLKQNVETDEWGGVAGGYSLPVAATLGAYQISVNDGPRRVRVGGMVAFRVEEYKKPEFEVTVESPEKPVQLGESISVKIVAKYYFGGAVTNADVKYKVHRTKKDQRWFPYRQWDWLYGTGYWWYAPETAWYPGFSRWGCLGPVPFWWGYNPDPPELVLDEEGRIGPDGTLTFEIDTALAKAMHSDSDHEYTITAEVVDASRRTIVGGGSVVVARQPFKVYAWTDRGYVRAGDAFTAHFSARTADGKPVQGRGELKLLKIKYAADGTPEETVVETWSLDPKDDGTCSQMIRAAQAGQYRLSYTLDDGQGNRIEGGQLLTVVGDGFTGADFRFNDLELTVEQAEYQPGDKVRLLINTNRLDSTVLLWLRPSSGVYAEKPIVLRIKGKSATYEFPVTHNDMPNFFIEATTISGARSHQVAKMIVVPPVERVLNVSIEPSSDKYLPGEEAKVRLKLTELNGEPFVGTMVMTMYDRAIEYISGGSNVPGMREFFWKWQRQHHPQSETSLGRWSNNLVKSGQKWMTNLGVFGHMAADVEQGGDENHNLRFDQRQHGRNRLSGGGLGGIDSAPGAALAMEGAEFQLGARGAVMDKMERDNQADDASEMAPVTVRTEFADAAYWNANLHTDADGTAEVSIKMPENLTGWKIRTWALGTGTRVGEATVEVVTAKNIMVRLQAPRFFVEKDEVVLSAVVHNYLDAGKQARVVLDLSGDTLQALDSPEQTVDIPAGGDVRVDWRVKVVREGEATITMTALTDVESDAMQMKFPVFVHGMLKTESFSNVVRADQNSTAIEFTVPEERRPDQSRLEVRFSPTLAGAMVDALPYLVDYPYGCTEQTLNRFLPTVLTQNILKRMNLDLAAIRDKRTNLNAQQIGDPQLRAAQWKRLQRNPVFDEDEVERMVKQGVRDLTSMQCSDGGWGWFSGYGERSYPHTTAVVVHGLQLAKENGVALVPDVLERGVTWLQRYQQEQVALLKEGDRLRDLPSDKWPRNARYKMQADNLDALVYMVLLDADIASDVMKDYLYRDRLKLSLYGMALFGLALDKQQDLERRDMLIQNIDQFVKVDDENQTAYIDLPNHGNYWWYWYGDTIEANAYYLKLLSRVNPQDPKAAGLVKYLLNNRRHGTYWNSTRDTAVCIEALADYLQRSGEDRPEMTVEIWLDGVLKQAVEITPEVLFQFDNSFIVEGAELTSGAHRVEIRRQGKGPVYANAYVTNFTLEDFITSAGLEIKVQRKIYKLVQREGAEAVVQGDRGQAVDQKVEKYDRVELQNLSELISGDLIEIELEIESKNDYEYVIFEDMKAAGFEPVDLRSGYTTGGLGAYVEFRDERVAFFMRTLARGRHSVSYRLRSEIPGQFSALPAKAHAMYAPELRGNSDEIKLRIVDR